MAEEKAWQPLELVKVTSEYLAGKKCHSPRLDAEVLLCSVLGLERRVDLYAGFERKISGKELASYRELIRRRAAREPVSRILGQRDFMGLSFTVTPDVLSPRPETEILVETALERLRPPRRYEEPEEEAGVVLASEAGLEEHGLGVDGGGLGEREEMERLLDSYAADVDSEEDLEREEEPVRAEVKSPAVFSAALLSGGGRGSGGKKVVSGRGVDDGVAGVVVLDLGTGSGCVGVSVAALLYRARVVAVDASPKALQVAKRNAARLGVGERMTFRQGDWFSACSEGERFDVIVSNPPYLVEGDGEIWPEVSEYDPPLALYGGRDGLDCYRRIIPSAPEWLKPEGWILFEVGAGQAVMVGQMLERRGFREVSTVKDYAGISRVVAAKAPVE